MAAQEPGPPSAEQGRRRTVGVVLAGGVGQRVGLNMPKQLLKVAGRTIIEHTLAVFEAAPEIDEIVVLMAPGHVAEAEEIVRRGGFGKVSTVVEGGASRTESTWRALRAIGSEECDVLLHDAVRPLLEPRIISDCVEALRTHRAVGVAIPSSDTMVVAASGPHGEVIQDVPDRSRLRRVQTPQCFRLSVIRQAYERAFADPEFATRPATDDCGVVLRYLPQVPIRIVPGSEHNMKVTHRVDVHIAERLFELAGRAAPAAAGPQARRRAFEGRTVVVFDGGGDDGLGARVAALAAGYGAAVHRFSRDRDGVRVEDPASVSDALDRVAKETGRVDHVLDASGMPRAGRPGDPADQAMAEAVQIGFLGPVTVARAAFPHLRETGGRLVLTVAPSAAFGRAGAGPDASARAARAAVAELTRALAEEWSEAGVRVNCVNTEPEGTGGAAGEPSPRAIAEVTLDLLVSGLTGRVVDLPGRP
ncbi:SDR family oxidoreductase [Sphaerisporangium dianthi]|uniref:2-C-methyl-D-erythritol 4-phosphate cytidylyltransferase n=1 Tax=Sphaerisporangium dianthi TaxID=1436120 RepID=A0ABV9CFB5_9ACTN